MLPQNYILPPKTDEWTTDTLRIRFKLFKLHLFAFFPTISFPVAEFPKSSPRMDCLAENLGTSIRVLRVFPSRCRPQVRFTGYHSRSSSSHAPLQRCKIRWTPLLGQHKASDGNFAVIICRQRNS